MDDHSATPQEFSSVTQCPFCQTAFHVGIAQLDAAGGRVRCGGCLRVFNAKNHFLVEQGRLFDDLNGSDEPLFDDFYGLDEPADRTNGPLDSEADTDSLNVDLFGAEIQEDDEPVILGDYDHYSGISIPRKAILENRVDEFRQEDYEHASAEEVLGDHQYLLEAGADLEPESEYLSLSSIDDELYEELDENLAEIYALDNKEDSFSSDDHAEAEAFEDREESWDWSDDTESEEDPDLTGIEEDVDEGIEDEFQEATEVEQEFDEGKFSLPHHQPDAFFIHSTSKDSRKAGVIWWLALAVAVVSLPIQLLFSQPESMVIKPWFQQLGAAICPGIGCAVPQYSAPHLIRISGFIEPHPEYQDSLVAKIDLRNQGLAEQPFPPVAIYFRNLNGQVTASRVFQPEEYLQGEARAYGNMPLNRNVQLELELLDPGEQSTSYELYISN